VSAEHRPLSASRHAPHPVLLSDGVRGEPVGLRSLAASAAEAADDVPGAALALAGQWSERLPLPGSGATVELWEALATLAAADLSVARAVEPHLDAVAILAEAGLPRPAGTWGVYAAEGPGVRLEARPEPAGGWLLTGTKPWCSLAGDLDHALLTAWVDAERRGLFAVDLRGPGVRAVDGEWHARGLSRIVSGSIELDDVAATEVGGPGWYLRRDGFAWGGIGVAAVWYGGAVGVARRLLRQARVRTPDQVALVHLGRVDTALGTARRALRDAAAAVDAGTADGAAGALLALRVRQVVADAAETVLGTVERALGPGPLALEPDHAARVADLRLYLRQHHAERDTAALGGLLVDAPDDGRGW
jgi:alkylation response protein AidB-like acyl-CoA dehydrogenase